MSARAGLWAPGYGRWATEALARRSAILTYSLQPTAHSLCPGRLTQSPEPMAQRPAGGICHV
jgi:hypothetical protein